MSQQTRNKFATTNFSEEEDDAGHPKHEPFWNWYYRRIFHDFEHFEQIPKNTELQMSGVDRLVFIRRRKEPIRMEEKLRRKHYDDFAMEEWSMIRYGDEPGFINKIGWSINQDSISDLVAYSTPQACTLMPMRKLVQSCRNRLYEWRRNEKKYKKHQNKTVKTSARGDFWYSVVRFVPWEEIIKDIGKLFVTVGRHNFMEII